MLMGISEEKGTGETTKDKVCEMIEEGYLRSVICERLDISPASYWEIKKEWLESKRRKSAERREFHKLRISVHERGNRLLIRLTKEVARYCETSTVEEIERILKGLPLVNDREELQEDMGVLQKKEKEIEDAALKAGVERRKEEMRKFNEVLKKAEARKLRALYKDAARHGLSPDETMRRAKRIGALYRTKKM